MAGIDWNDPQVQGMLRELGPVTASIAGSQDREFAHAKGLQSQELSAKSSMHKSSLANAMAIEKLRSGTQRYGIDTEKEVAFRGQDVQKFGIEQDTLRSRWTNALNYLSMAAQLRGPENVFQYANFARGASQSDFPAFLSDLMADTGIGGMVSGASSMQGFGAPSGATPPAATLAGLANQLSTGNTGMPGGGPGTVGSGPGNPGQGLLGQIDQIARNFHRLAPGSLEALNEDEMGILTSGLGAAGHSLPTLLNTYAQSRPMQGAARSA